MKEIEFTQQELAVLSDTNMVDILVNWIDITENRETKLFLLERLSAVLLFNRKDFEHVRYNTTYSMDNKESAKEDDDAVMNGGW